MPFIEANMRCIRFNGFFLIAPEFFVFIFFIFLYIFYLVFVLFLTRTFDRGRVAGWLAGWLSSNLLALSLVGIARYAIRGEQHGMATNSAGCFAVFVLIKRASRVRGVWCTCWIYLILLLLCENTHIIFCFTLMYICICIFDILIWGSTKNI